MATALPDSSPGLALSEFTEALNGLGVGIVSLDFVRDAISRAMQADGQAPARIQAILNDAFNGGRLAPEDFEALSADLGNSLDEDPPTEWSEDVINESAPASDTKHPAPAGDPDQPENPAALLYPGAVLRNRFVLQLRVKSGEINEVFKALDRRRQEAGASDPWVAIKLLMPGARNHGEGLRLLQREATLAQRLHHPHIVRVVDLDREDDYTFITMEWLEGETLADLLTQLRNRPVTPAHARQILTEIGDALEFAHSRGITHADVKPGNIFLTSDGMAKLLDFGIARDAGDADSRPGANARTPAYASCEVLEGGAPTPQDDVYALACVAYRMLAGRRAFGHHDALAAERAGRGPARIHSLNSTQWSALERALAFRRADRTPDMASFMRDFNGAAAAAYDQAVQPGQGPAPEVDHDPAPAMPAAVETTAPESTAWRLRAVAAGAAALALLAAFWPDPGEVIPETVPPLPAIAARPEPQAVPASTGAEPDDAPGLSPEGARTETVARPGNTPAAASRAEERTAKPKPADAAAGKPGPAAQATQGSQPEPASQPPPPAQPLARTITGTTSRAPIPAEQVAMNGTLLPPSGADGQAHAAMPGQQPSTGAVAGEVATAPAEPAGIREVPLSELEFQRYVEPSNERYLQGNAPPGWVQVAFTVDTKGTPRDIRITESSPPGRYDRLVLATVKRWRFVPVMEDGSAVERRTGVRLRFEPE